MGMYSYYVFLYMYIIVLWLPFGFGLEVHFSASDILRPISHKCCNCPRFCMFTLPLSFLRVNFGRNFLVYIFILKHSLSCFLIYFRFTWLSLIAFIVSLDWTYFQYSIEGWNINVMGNQTRGAYCISSILRSFRMLPRILHTDWVQTSLCLWWGLRVYGQSGLCRRHFVVKTFPIAVPVQLYSAAS